MEDAQEIKTHLAGLETCVKLADALGAQLIRGFTFWAGEGFKPEAIASRFEGAVSILEKSGKTLVLESDPNVNASNARMLVQVIEAVGSPHVQGLWDPGNDIWDPNGEIPFPDGYNIIKPRMAHIHMKDSINKNGKREGVPIGKGQVDWEGQLRALIADGYSGYISLETHYRHTQEIPEEMLALPRGTAFSLGGYEATRENLEHWKTLMEKIM
jgi:sugar phosphate isomerase/epimerase